MRPRPQRRERQASLVLPIYLSYARSDVHVPSLLHVNAEDRGRTLLLALDLRLRLLLTLRLTLRLLLALFLALLLPRQQTDARRPRTETRNPGQQTAQPVSHDSPARTRAPRFDSAGR